jgi:AraC-like DNA-binding protein
MVPGQQRRNRFVPMTDHQKQFALSLIAYVVQREISASELCEKANIDLKSVTKSAAYKLTTRQIDDLWHHASQLTKDPLFGLHFGESLQLSALGAVGEIIKSSRTVGEAIQMAASLTYLVTDLFSMEVKREKYFFSIQLISKNGMEGMDFMARQLADTLMVFIVHELDGLLLQKVTPKSVRYPYALSNPDEYERVLRCKPTKHKSDFSIQLDNRYLDEPILSANYELQSLFLEKINSKKVKTVSGVLSGKIYQHLMSNAYLGILSLEDVAANFNVTPRSLQRRLQEEGITFQQLSESVRRSLAIHYMQSGKHQLKEISDMLGYNELSAFSRAFKRWTGKSPVNYFA